MKILIHRLGPGLGDIVRCLPALDAARRRWPTADITCMAPPEYVPLFDGNPHIDRAIAPLGRFGRRARHAACLAESLSLSGRGQGEGATLSAPHGRAPQPHPSPVGLPGEERGPRQYDLMIDLLGPAAELERRDPSLSRQEIFCRLVGAEPAKWIGWYRVTDAERAWAAGFLRIISPSPLRGAPQGTGGAEGRGHHPHPTLSLEGRGMVVALQRHAAQPLRDWPWVDELAGRLRNAGSRVLLLERRMDTTVRQLAALIAACDLLIAPDSGPLHVAALVGTPCLGLFGPTDARVIAQHYPRHTCLTGCGRGDACVRPCRERSRAACRRAPGARCLAVISAEEAADAALECCHGRKPVVRRPAKMPEPQRGD